MPRIYKAFILRSAYVKTQVLLNNVMDNMTKKKIEKYRLLDIKV